MKTKQKKRSVLIPLNIVEVVGVVSLFTCTHIFVCKFLFLLRFGVSFSFYSNLLVFGALQYAFCLFTLYLLNFQFLARCHNHCLTIHSQWALFKVFHTRTQKIESKERERASDNNVNNKRYLYYFSFFFFFQVLVHFDLDFFLGKKILLYFLLSW